MRHNRGFTLLETTISTALFAAGAIYVYATFAGVTQNSRSATVGIDLGSQNKQSITRLFNELQASSLTPQDTDGLDSTEPEPVFVVEDDPAAPTAMTKAKIVTRSAGSITQKGDNWTLGKAKEQARERTITGSKLLRFRKVIGYRFNADAGSIVPQWSRWVTFRLNDRNQLVRVTEAGATRVIANHVDAFDVDPRPDGTVLVTVITARRDPSGKGWRRYANAVTVNPKN